MEGLEDQKQRDYGIKNNNDAMLLRFLRARNFDLDKAFEMMVETLKFRTSFQNKGVEAITSRDCIYEMSTGKCFFHGRDKGGRPICILRSRFHDPNKSETPESERFAVCTMEYGRKLLLPPGETVTLIFDMGNAAMKNIDFGNIKFMVKTLQSFYPECLYKVLIFKSSWLFWGVWKCVKPMLDPITAEKIAFVDKKNIKEFIDPDQTLVEFGGTDQWQYTAHGYSKMVDQALAAPAPAQTPIPAASSAE